MTQSPARRKAYQKEYDARPENIRKRAMRNAARRELEKEGLVHKGDGKEVDHKQPLASGGTNARANLRVVSAARNRGWRRGKSGYNP